jgi:hypothetical protein
MIQVNMKLEKFNFIKKLTKDRIFYTLEVFPIFSNRRKAWKFAWNTVLLVVKFSIEWYIKHEKITLL